MASRRRRSPDAEALRPELTWSEARFQAWVKARAEDTGWHVAASDLRKLEEDAAAWGVTVEPDPLPGLVFHHRFSLGSEAGWPDLTLVRRRDRRLVFAELKSQKGPLRPRQAQVLDLLRCLEQLPIEGHVRPGEEEAFAMFVNALRGPRIQVFVWRPADAESILEVLA